MKKNNIITILFYRSMLCFIALCWKSTTGMNPNKKPKLLEPKLLEQYNAIWPCQQYRQAKRSNNGKVVAFVQEKTFKVFAAKTGKLLFKQTVQKINDEINQIKLTLPGKHIIIVYDYNKVAVYDIENKKHLITYAHEKFIYPIYISNNGRFTVSASTNMILKAYDTKHKNLLLKKQLNYFEGLPGALYITENGKYIATVVKGSFVKIYNTKTKKMLFEYQFDNLINNITISKDGTHFAASTQYYQPFHKNNLEIIAKIYIYNLKTKNPKSKKLESYLHNDHDQYLRFTPCGKFLVSGSLDGNFKVYCNNNKNVIFNIQTKDKASSVGLSSDWKKLIVCTKSDTIKKYQSPLTLFLAYQDCVNRKKNIKNLKNNLFRKTKNKKLCDLIVRTK
ncbi:WD40 repeat domain-containing protein [Candidatus Dependentiae bacterium]